MDTRKYSGKLLTVEIVMIIVGLLFLAPFYFLLVNSVKTLGDIMTNSASWPTTFLWKNFAKAWDLTNFPHVFLNSLIITVISVVLIALFAAMGAYRMVRANTLTNKILFTIFVAAMVIPFQSIMIPLLKVVNTLGLNEVPTIGVIVCNLGLGASMTLFLFHGFVKTIPLEIEEAATVDGCNPFGVFFRIVLPLLKPMLMTVIILNSLWIWNDYLLPSLLLQQPSMYTIPLATYSFFGQYTKQWDIALPALILGIAPIVIFFLLLQRYIVEGVAAGSVKG